MAQVTVHWQRNPPLAPLFVRSLNGAASTLKKLFFNKLKNYFHIFLDIFLKFFGISGT